MTGYRPDLMYIGWRPLLNGETAPPSGGVPRYLQFVMDPANSGNFATEGAKICVYATSSATVVPVTPIP